MLRRIRKQSCLEDADEAEGATESSLVRVPGY